VVHRTEPDRVVAVRTRAGKTRFAGRTYLIRSGDTLSGIAARYGLSWQRLAVLNDLDDPDLIYAGDTLILG
jgi:LysM repeat protein